MEVSPEGVVGRVVSSTHTLISRGWEAEVDDEDTENEDPENEDPEDEEPEDEDPEDEDPEDEDPEDEDPEEEDPEDEAPEPVDVCRQFSAKLQRKFQVCVSLAGQTHIRKMSGLALLHWQCGRDKRLSFKFPLHAIG